MYKHILEALDHTCLKPDATHQDIDKLCRDAVIEGAHSICVAPYYTHFARGLLDLYADMYCQPTPKLCVVVGFPHGNTIPTVKGYEAKKAVQFGADEIDMVINIGMLKERCEAILLDEIEQVCDAAPKRIVKVIVETGVLSEEDKVYACHIINKTRAQFIKTSTGYNGGGATVEDIELFKKHLIPFKSIKASGGISTVEDAEKFLDAGANRIGASKVLADIQRKKSENISKNS